MTERIPEPGEPFFTGFESDYDPDGYHENGGEFLQIKSVGMRYECGAFSITDSEGIGQDCEWSPLIRAWCYQADVTRKKKGNA